MMMMIMIRDDNDDKYSDDHDGRLNRILIVSFPLLAISE